MGKGKDGTAHGKYTLEFKQEAVRLVKGGQFGGGLNLARFYLNEEY